MAKKNIKHYLTSDQKCARFIVSDFVPKLAPCEASLFKPEFDVVLCLNVTKWVHLHHGDDGLKAFLRRCYACLRPGGVFILEPQPMSSYARRRRLSKEIAITYKSIQFKPDQFPQYLTELGFSRYEFLNESSCSNTAFCRPIYAFFKA